MSQDRKNRVFGIVIVIFILVGAVLTFSFDDDSQTLWEKLVASQQVTWAELKEVPEFEQLIVSGVPEEALFTHIFGQGNPRALFPVTDEGTIVVAIDSPDFREWTVQEARFSYLPDTLIPEVVSNIEPVSEDGVAYAQVYFNTFPEGSYHQTYVIPSITIYGRQAQIQQQLNWQPFTSTRKDIHIFVVSQQEMELLGKIVEKCGILGCK